MNRVFENFRLVCMLKAWWEVLYRFCSDVVLEFESVVESEYILSIFLQLDSGENDSDSRPQDSNSDSGSVDWTGTWI